MTYSFENKVHLYFVLYSQYPSTRKANWRGMSPCSPNNRLRTFVRNNRLPSWILPEPTQNMPRFAKGKRTLGPCIQVRFPFNNTKNYLVSSFNVIIGVKTYYFFVIIMRRWMEKRRNLCCKNKWVHYVTFVCNKTCWRVHIFDKIFILTGLLAVNTH